MAWKSRLSTILLASLRLILVPPIIVRKGGDSGFSSAYIAGGGEEWLLFDVSGSKCSRILRLPRYCAAYQGMRAELSKYVCAPWFYVTDGGRELVEGFVVGEALKNLRESEQARIARDLIRSYEAAASGAEAGSAAGLLGSAIARIRLDRLPPDLRSFLDSGEVLSRACHWPLIPSHGDLHSLNVIVSGSKPFVIDWESRRLRRLPFWYDPLSLPLLDDWQSFGCTPIADLYRAGGLDESLSSLWASATSDSLVLPRDRAVLVALWLLVFVDQFPNPASEEAPEARMTRLWERWLYQSACSPDEHPSTKRSGSVPFESDRHER